MHNVVHYKFASPRGVYPAARLTARTTGTEMNPLGWGEAGVIEVGADGDRALGSVDEGGGALGEVLWVLISERWGRPLAGSAE